MGSMGELVLAIETSNPSSGGEPGVALGELSAGGVRKIGIEPIGPGQRHDDLLMPAIDRVMRGAGHSPGELDRILCSVGPGGYTGLRIATAAANVVALATGARLFAVPSAWVAAAAEPGDKPIAVALASKGETCHLTRFERPGEPGDAGRLIGAAAIQSLDVGVLIADRFLPEPIREACVKSDIEIREPKLSPGVLLGLAGIGLERSVGSLAPLYGREAEAIVRWRELHGDG